MLYRFEVERELRKVHEQELARKLEISRLLADARLSQPSLRQRVLLRLSDALIATGEWLRQADDRQPTVAELA
jgi:hypothetical protein